LRSARGAIVPLPLPEAPAALVPLPDVSVVLPPAEEPAAPALAPEPVAPGVAPLSAALDAAPEPEGEAWAAAPLEGGGLEPAAPDGADEDVPWATARPKAAAAAAATRSLSELMDRTPCDAWMLLPARAGTPR
jgi:hypothetical protein